MYELNANTLAASWATSLLTGNEVAKSDLAAFIFTVSTYG